MRNQKFIVVGLLVLFFVSGIDDPGVRAQITDDFSDENLTQSPTWSGDLLQFETSFSQAIPSDMRPALRLKGEGADTSYLSLESSWAGPAEWRFWIKLSFNTSAGNFARFYLISDQVNLEAPLNGYFVQIGGTNDSLMLYRQEGFDIFPLITGENAYTGNSTNILRIKINRSQSGNWEMFSAPGGLSNYQSEGSATDVVFSQSSHAGLYAKYTSSNAQKIYFDDLYIGPEIIDSLPPEIEKISFYDLSSIGVTFTEALSFSTISDAGNFRLADNSGPETVVVDPFHDQARLVFQEAFEQGKEYDLIIEKMEDLAGNVVYGYSASFVFHIPQTYDVVINEIMADPVPAVSLPEFEYIELFNVSDYPVELEGWILRIGTSEKVFSGVNLEASGYLICCEDDVAIGFSEFGKAYGFSSFSISNSGVDIELLDSSGRVISYAIYDPGFLEKEKQDGGWSLEQVNPLNPCGGNMNWSASENYTGGSPGSPNSVYSDLYYAPEIESICLSGSKELSLGFSQAMSADILLNPLYFYVDHSVGSPLSLSFSDPARKNLILFFEDNFTGKTIYSLSLSQPLENCSGVEMYSAESLEFGLPEAVEENDVVINEILFNPLLNGAEYLEIFNRSHKIIDLATVSLKYVRETPPNPPDTSSYSLSDNCLQVLPLDYLVVSSDINAVASQYHSPNPEKMHEMVSMPDFNNESGKVLLADAQGTILDALIYDEDMHYPILNSVKGVSLERINYDQSSGDETNWHSASANVGFGTPAYQNSQFLNNEETVSNFQLFPTVFSPNGDGFEDVTGITYSFDGPGNLCTTTVFDAGGRSVSVLKNNEMLGTGGVFYWDGTDASGNLVYGGIYLLYVQVLKMNGQSLKFKLPCAIVY